MNTKSKTQQNSSAIEPALATGAVKNSARRDWICVGLLFVTTVVVFASFLFSDDMMVSSDQMAAIGNRIFTNESFSTHGQLPQWLSSRLGGMPTIDAKFGDIFYPPSYLLRPLVSAHRYHGYSMIIHVFLAGVFFFFMLRRSFGCSRLISFAGAMFYMLSPQFLTHVQPGHDGKMHVIAWLPFVVWRLRSMLAALTPRSAALFAAGMGMIVLTGHTQMVYFACMGIFLYWITDVVRGIIVDKDGKKKVALKTAFFWGGVFLGLGIGFIMFWPSYMFVRDAHSVRGIDRGWEFAISWSMNWAEVFSLWVHEFGNALEYYWGQNFFKLNSDYVGFVPITFAVLAIISKPKSVWRWLWAGIAALAVIFALGGNTPIYKLFYHVIPGVNRFRAPSMILYWLTFSTVLLSVFFMKDILNKRFENLRADSLRKWNIGLIVAMCGATLLALMFSNESIATSFAMPMMGDMDPARSAQVFKINFEKNFVPNLWLWWVFIIASLGMLWGVINGKMKPAVFVCVIIAISVIDMSRVNAQFIQQESKWRYYYNNDAALVRLKSEFDDAPFRVFALPRTFATQNQEGAYGLEGVGGFHDNELNCYRAFRGDQGDRNFIMDIASADGRLSMARINGNTPFLDIADVEYILMAGQNGIMPIKNPTNLGRLSYAADYILPPDMSAPDSLKELEILVSLRGGLHDYRTTVALLEEPQLPFARRQSAPVNTNIADDVIDNNVNANVADDTVDTNPVADDHVNNNTDDDNVGDDDVSTSTSNRDVINTTKNFSVEWIRYSPNQRIAKVTMPDDGFLRISEVYYPGWRITANGVEKKYYRSDVAWMAIPLAAGDYEIVMEPRSLYLAASVWVTAVSTLIVVAVLVVAYIRKKRRSNTIKTLL